LGLFLLIRVSGVRIPHGSLALISHPWRGELPPNLLRIMPHIKKYPIKNAETVADYCASMGETALEAPLLLLEEKPSHNILASPRAIS
jgi:hypothetical protein